MAGSDEGSEPIKGPEMLPKGFPDDYQGFDDDVMSDVELIQSFCEKYGVDDTAELTEEQHTLILELCRRQMFATAKEMFFEYRYGRKVQVDVNAEMREYFELFLDMFYPPSDPRRLAFEIAWMDKRIGKLKEWQPQLEAIRRRQGHHELILPKPAQGPGGTSAN